MSGNFSTVQIEPIEPLRTTDLGAKVWRFCSWCRKLAYFKLVRTSSLSGNVFEDTVCEDHIVPWKEMA